jgi:hypothetical protein
VTNHDALQLAMRFRAAKHALVRQLMQRYADDQKGSAAAAGEGGKTLAAPGNDSLQLQLAHMAGSGRHMKQSNAPLMLLDPLLHTVKLCLQTLTSHVIGRGGGVGCFSIHDSSPYSLAMALNDSDFLGLQPVRDYTRYAHTGEQCQQTAYVVA